MSRDIRQYWAEIGALEATLDEFVWLTSTQENHAGGAVEVAAPAAARLLHAKSHRLATEDEVEAHRAGERVANRKARKEALRKEGSALVVVRERKRSK